MAGRTAEAVVLSNGALRVAIDTARGAFDVVDLATGVRWRMDPWFRSAGEVTLEERSSGARLVCDLSASGSVEVTPEGGRARIVFRDFRTAAGAVIGGTAMVATMELLDAAAELRLAVQELTFDDARYRLAQLQYPARFGALESYVERGALVVPHWEGALVPTGRVALPPLDLWQFEDASRTASAIVDLSVPTMPWYGAYLDRPDCAGFLCIVETAADVQFQIVANNAQQHRYDPRGEVSPLMRLAAVSPVWLASRGGLGEPRSARFRFGTGLDYVGQAKQYRAYARATGTFRSLQEKAAERPAVAWLAGAPYVALYAGYPHYAPGVHPAYAGYRYQQVEAVVRDLAGTLRLPRAFVHLWGGYTQQPPGALPFDTAPGPVSDLKAAVDAAHDAGYLFALYNDFTAMLEESPLWNGRLMYQEAGGQCMIGRPWNRICASHLVELAARQLPAVVETLGVCATYVDCVDVFWRECAAPEHPATRAENIANRRALQAYLQALGLVFGGEHVHWWAVPTVDYCNGMSMPASASPMLSRFPVPLWHLAFHDAVVAYRHAADDYTRDVGHDFADRALRDLLLGVPPLYFLNLADYTHWRKRIALADRATGEVLRRITFDEMERHASLTEDRQVQRTRFASGVQVTVNFGLVPRDVGDGEPVPPKGFVVTGLDGAPRQASFRLDLHTGTS